MNDIREMVERGRRAMTIVNMPMMPMIQWMLELMCMDWKYNEMMGKVVDR